MTSIKSTHHVEISEQVVNVDTKNHGNDDVDGRHVVLTDDEDFVRHFSPRKSVTRNAMGEYIPEEGETALTQQAFSGPGPSSYSPTIELTKPGAPQYSIVGKLKDRKDVSSPGPKYDTSRDMTWSRRTKTLKAKLETSPYRPKPRDHLTCSLGSAAYKVDYYDAGKHSVAYSIRSKDQTILGPPNNLVKPVDTQGFSSPGPSYTPHDSRGPVKSIGVKFERKNREDFPGPAQYNIKHLKPGSQFSFGRRLRSHSVAAFGSPGPGAYEIHSAIGSGVATSIRSRQRLRSKNVVPSPNAYILPDAFRNAPRHSMTYRSFDSEVYDTPGPANYNQVSSQVLRASPKFSCRKQCRPGFPVVLNYPEYGLMKNEHVGPDSYNGDKGFDKNKSPAYSIANKIPRATNNSPGPACYNIMIPCRPDARKAPEFSIGQLASRKVSEAGGPGPAAYHPKVIKSDAGYSMSSRQKPKKTVITTPAPNAYKVHKGQTSKGVYNGSSASFKSRASPYVYSGFPNLAKVTT